MFVAVASDLAGGVAALDEAVFDCTFEVGFVGGFGLGGLLVVGLAVVGLAVVGLAVVGLAVGALAIFGGVAVGLGLGLTTITVFGGFVVPG